MQAQPDHPKFSLAVSTRRCGPFAWPWAHVSMKQATGPFRMESAKRPDFGQDIDLPPGAKGSGPEGMVREMKARRNVLRNVLPGLERKISLNLSLPARTCRSGRHTRRCSCRPTFDRRHSRLLGCRPSSCTSRPAASRCMRREHWWRGKEK